MNDYENAKACYRRFGVDVERALARLAEKAISIHCWQGDDVTGFDQKDGKAGDGIQTTGNYPGKARNFEELKADFLKAAGLIPGKKRINLHASYAVFPEGEWVDRDRLEYKYFVPWVDFAKENSLGIDFNPTCFSHPMVKDGLTLSHPDEAVRRFWIDHCKAGRRIAQRIGEELGDQVLNNVWVPDGFKDIPADRMSPRARLKDSLDQILAMDYDKSKVLIAVESKVFGIGMESCTVGSHEFYMNYAASRGIMCLLDSGHFHPTEMISDKISSMLLFSDKIALHVSRPVRWDSDHVVLFDDETREIAKEIVRNDPDRVLLALDFFDASINRICAWVVGMRNMQKALLYALLMPNEKLAKLQEERRFTELMMEQEELKTYPFGDVWDYFCQMNQVPVKEQWFKEVQAYEKEVLLKRS